MKHAKGPWSIDRTNSTYCYGHQTVIRDADGWSIAHLYGVWNNAKANEVLIAAAPTMLAALQTYAELVQTLIDNWSAGDLASAVNMLEEFRDNEATAAIDAATKELTT